MKQKSLTMKKRTIILSLMGLIMLSGLWAQEMTANEMLEKADRILSPPVCTILARLTTHQEGRSDRIMEFESYYNEDIGTFMEVTSPARSRGTKFLQLDDVLWMYTPRSNSSNAIRLSPRDAFQGSSFSNNDISDHNYADNYQSVFLEEETIEHEELGTSLCYLIQGTAIDNTAPYGKIKVWLAKESLIPLKMEYYTRSGLLYKKMELSQLKEMAGQIRPSQIIIYSIEEARMYSMMEYLSIKTDVTIPDSIFTRSYLTR